MGLGWFSGFLDSESKQWATRNPRVFIKAFFLFEVLVLKFICLYALKGDKEALRKMPLDLMISSCCPK